MSGVISDNTQKASGVIASVASATLDSSDPTASTNPSTGVGTKWINTTSGEIFLCVDATAGANKWIGQRGRQVTSSRGIWGGGSQNSSGHTTCIDYVNISVLGNATDFGDLTGHGNPGQSASTSNGVTGRGLFFGGYISGYYDGISYVTINTPGNSTDFGDSAHQGRSSSMSVSNGTNDRAVWCGGSITGGHSAGSQREFMDYVTVSSASNASDFGDMIDERGSGASFSNGVHDRGILYAGYEGFTYNTPFEKIEYITIQSTGNGTTFGNANMVDYSASPNGIAAVSGCSNDTNDRGIKMGGNEPVSGKIDTIDYLNIVSLGDSQSFGTITTATGSGMCCVSDGTGERGLGAGGSVGSPSVDVNTIEYVTISTPSDAADFGDLTEARHWHAGCSNGAE